LHHYHPAWDEAERRSCVPLTGTSSRYARPTCSSTLRATIERSRLRPETLNPHLQYARRRAYRSDDPFWWSNLAAVYATQRPPELRRAREWYRRAARRLNLRGLFEYGLMLIQGEGGPSRPAEGRRLVERAATLGEIDALRVLSHAYAHGTFTFPRSARRAKQMQRSLDRALFILREELADENKGRRVLSADLTQRGSGSKRR